MQKDPLGTAESTRLPLDDEDREAIGNWDMSPTGDEVLKDRVAKLVTAIRRSAYRGSRSIGGRLPR
jgi:hypothetical protein